MKKVFVSMMLASALLIGGSAMAQSPADGNTGATQKENVQKGKKGDKKYKGQKSNRPQFNPFDGVQLTDDQQQKLAVLRQGLGPVMLSPEQQAKIPENKNLTEEQKKQLKAEKKAKKLEAKKNYLNGVKEILTPDQYVIFLENCYLYAPQGQTKAKGMKQGKHVKVKQDKGTEKHGFKAKNKANSI